MTDMNMLAIILQKGGGYEGGGMFALAIVITVFAGVWMVFSKAGKPGWAALVPIYNAYVILKIIGRPGWWLLLLLIPLVNFVVGIIVSIELARSFGKGTGFGLGLAFLAPVFWMILGFGSAEYKGPAART